MRNLKVNEQQRSSLVFVDTPTRRDKENLTELGLDMTEHGGEDFIAVVLHGAADRALLERAGLTYEVEVADLGAQDVRAARRRPPLRARRPPQRPAERPRHLPPPLRLHGGDEGARAAEPQPRAADHPARGDLRGPPGRGDRDHDQRGQHPRRQAGLPADGRPPRARVALRRARDGVGHQPDQWLPQRQRAGPQPRRAGADDRHPDRQPRRLRGLARGRRGARPRQRRRTARS